jgi:hypothetical protein
VALEKRLVDGDILDGDQAFSRLELDNAIDQQEGVAMRQEFQDLLDVERHSLAPDSVRACSIALDRIITNG